MLFNYSLYFLFTVKVKVKSVLKNINIQTSISSIDELRN